MRTETKCNKESLPRICKPLPLQSTPPRPTPTSPAGDIQHNNTFKFRQLNLLAIQCDLAKIHFICHIFSRQWRDFSTFVLTAKLNILGKYYSYQGQQITALAGLSIGVPSKGLKLANRWGFPRSSWWWSLQTSLFLGDCTVISLSV